MAHISPEDIGAIITAVLIGTAAIIGAIARPLFDTVVLRKRTNNNPEVKPAECGVPEATIVQIHDLHSWHGPDHQGQQGWRGHGIENHLVTMEESLGAGFGSLREGQSEVSTLLRDLIKVTREK
jgi:hypothetical protein